jgi:hypothetical protein
MTVFGSYKMLKPEMVEAIAEYIKDNEMWVKYNTLADITVNFCIYCTEGLRSEFLTSNMDKIVNNIPYASDEVLCKSLL